MDDLDYNSAVPCGRAEVIRVGDLSLCCQLVTFSRGEIGERVVCRSETVMNVVGCEGSGGCVQVLLGLR